MEKQTQDKQQKVAYKPSKAPEVTKEATKRVPKHISALAAEVKAGKHGHGLKLAAALGDDFAAVIKATN